jgi:hypothetical protein
VLADKRPPRALNTCPRHKGRGRSDPLQVLLNSACAEFPWLSVPRYDRAVEDIEITHIDADLHSGRLPDGSVHILRFAEGETHEVGWIKRDAAIYVILGCLILGLFAIAISLEPPTLASRVLKCAGMLLYCPVVPIVWHGRIRRLVTAEQCAAKLDELERSPSPGRPSS